jgi:hypothetical protein
MKEVDGWRMFENEVLRRMVKQKQAANNCIICILHEILLG